MEIPSLSNLKFHSVLTDECECLCDYPISKKNWSNGRLNTDEAKEIVVQCIDNRNFIRNGAWTIVGFQDQESSLILIRDVIGIKPMYYSHTKEYFAFSSSLNSLLTVIQDPLDLNMESLAEMLLFNKMENTKRTLIRQINEVSQGEFVRFNLRTWELKKNKYASPSFENELSDYNEAIQRNRAQLEEYVKDQVIDTDSDNHALLLSGGIDSSCLAHLLCPQIPTISFYTMSYSDIQIDESKYAKAVTDQFSSVHWSKVHASSEEFIGDVEEMHSIIEWPTFSSGTYNQFKLLQTCSKDGKKYIWDGLGADALYGGHDYYRHCLFFEYLKHLRISAAGELLGWKENKLSELSGAFKTFGKRRIYQSKLYLRRFLDYTVELKLYNTEFLDYALKMTDKSRFRANTSLKQTMQDDFFEGGIRHLSRFTNRISSHFGIEMKYPFAENMTWAEEILSLPKEWLFMKGASKSILRDSFKNELPRLIYERRDKKGLQSPNNQWIEDQKDFWISYFEDHMNDIYNVDYIKQHYQSLWQLGDQPENYRYFKHISFAIWRKMMNI